MTWQMLRAEEMCEKAERATEREPGNPCASTLLENKSEKLAIRHVYVWDNMYVICADIWIWLCHIRGYTGHANILYSHMYHIYADDSIYSTYCICCIHVACMAYMFLYGRSFPCWRACQKAAAADATLVNVLNKEHNRPIRGTRMERELRMWCKEARMSLETFRGTFMAILETIANHDKAVKKGLTFFHNAKYMDKQIISVFDLKEIIV